MHLSTVLLGNNALLVRVVMIKLTSRTRGRDWKGGLEMEGLEREGKERESLMSGFPRIFPLSNTKGVPAKLPWSGRVKGHKKTGALSARMRSACIKNHY